MVVRKPSSQKIFAKSETLSVNSDAFLIKISKFVCLWVKNVRQKILSVPKVSKNLACFGSIQLCQLNVTHSIGI